MPDPVRRLPVPPLAGLEGQGCGALGSGGSAVRLPHSFHLRSSPVQGSHLSAFIPPLVHQRGGAERLFSGPCGQVRSGASSSAVSRLLQPAVRSVEDLGVLETGYRSLHPQLVRGRGSLPHGDHPVCTAVSSSGRLDGLHRPQGGLPADPCPSGFSSLPSVCCSGPSLPVLCPLLRPVHGPSGLLSGHGSCFRHSPLLGYPHEAVPRRLARPVLVSGCSPSRPPGRSQPLQGARDCSQPFQVSPSSISGGPIPWCRDRLPVFQGFSVFGARQQAVLNSRRISVLRRSSRQYLAAASRHPLISRPSSSWRPSAGPVSPTVSPSAVGSGGLVCADPVVSALPQGSSVVARPSSSVSRGVSRPGLPRSGLLVRRLGRGLGCSPRLSHRFRPLGPGAGCAVHQRARAPGYQGGPPPFSALSPRVGCLGFLRQQHCGVLSTQGGGHQVSVSELSGSGDPALDGVSFHSTPAPVHSGVSECPRGLPLSSSPTSSYRMVPSSGGFSIFKSSLAGANRLVCHVSKSPMLSLFLSLPGSIGGGHRRVPPVLGRASGLRLPSVVHSSQGASQAPCVSGSGTDANSPLLASTPLVCGPPSSVAGSSGGSAPPPRPPAPASVSLPLPGSPKASASCLATLRRFTRAAGFSSAVAAQASLSRRPSSRKAYQLKWQVYRQWCHSCGHSSSNPSLAKTADFLCWLHSSKHLGVSSIKGYRSMLSAVFRFQLPSLSSHPVLRDLLRSFALESAPRQLRPPAWDLTFVLRFLNTSNFEPLAEVPLRALTQKVLFLVAFATAKRVGELQALSSVVTFVQRDACLSYVPDFVAKSESLSRSIPRSFLVRSLSDFAAGLEDDLLLCPVRALRIYLDRLSTLSPLRRRLFVSPSRPSRPLSKNAISFFLRDVISHAGAARPEVGRLRAHDIRSVSTSVAFHRNWSVSSVLESATWASSSVFTSFYLRDLQHEFDGILSLGPFVAAGSTIG